MISYILGSDSVTVFHKGMPYTINKQAHTFGLVMKAINENSETKLDNALNIRQSIVNSLNENSNNAVVITSDKIFYEDREITGLIKTRIFEIIRLGLDVKPMIAFIENLMKNPSKRAVDELFGFLCACDLPITPDGHFLAYKKVRDDYLDCYSGTMDNSVGKVLEMQRNMVDEDKDNTCSYGLHFCSYEYLKHFGGSRIVVLKINPADVVAIPSDYNNSKGRTCRYEVVDEIPATNGLPDYKIKDSYEDKYDKRDEEENFDDHGTGSTNINKKSSAKLKPEDVRDIRNYYKNYSTIPGCLESICTEWGISRRQAMRIIKRQAWKNI